jgi:hypothetical protein
MSRFEGKSEREVLEILGGELRATIAKIKAEIAADEQTAETPSA